MKEQKERYVGHIVSLVLGIISILTALFYYISIPTGIISIIMGVKTYKKQGSKLAIAGFVTGIVGLSLTLIIYISLIFILLLQNMY